MHKTRSQSSFISNIFRIILRNLVYLIVTGQGAKPFGPTCLGQGLNELVYSPSSSTGDGLPTSMGSKNISHTKASDYIFQAYNELTQLVNVTLNISYIKDHQVLKYQSPESFKSRDINHKHNFYQGAMVDISTMRVILNN